MKVALTACGLVAACAIAVLALDQPAAAAPPPERSTCCAFPDQEYGSADGLTVLLPTGWKVRLAMMEHFAIEGDQGEWVSINPVPSHRVDAELRESQRRASNDPAVWTRTLSLIHI